MGNFSLDELYILNSITKDTRIVGITNYKWNNLSIPNNPFIFIDKIEFRFNNINPILIEINETDDGLTIRKDYEINKEINDIEHSVNEQIEISKEPALENKIWKEAVQQLLIGIEAEKENNLYLNNVLLFRFESEAVVISLHPEEGLMVDIFEEE